MMEIRQLSFILPLFPPLLFTLSVVLSACSTAPLSSPAAAMPQSAKKYDLVLIHGLANQHKWSEKFLDACLQIWGSGRVFVVHTGVDDTITTKKIHGRELVIGGDGTDAGTASLDTQTANLNRIVQKLHAKYGLDSPFSIIAHSMGGLVAREYIYQHPGNVAGLVTLGTPHHGSPLAESFQWVGFFLSATDAIEDLKPQFVERFNKTYPAGETPFAPNGKMFTIRGIPDGTDCFGWMGELFFGWQILSAVYGTESDGLVPYDSALIAGAEHIADFPHYDHYDLVREPDVARKAAAYLP